MLLSLLLACLDPSAPSVAPIAPSVPEGGLPSPAAPPAARQPPGPSAAAPGALLVRGEDCGLSLRSLPAGSVEVLAPGLPCGALAPVLDSDGQRAVVGDRLVDLRTGEVVVLPTPPRGPAGEEAVVGFDAQGRAQAVLSWGEEQIGFEEGPMFARTVQVASVLIEGAWAEQARWVTGPAITVEEVAREAWIEASRARGVTLMADAGAGELVLDGPLREALIAVEPGDWIAAGRPSSGSGPRFAWRVEQAGEGTVSTGPLRVFDGRGWFPVEGTDGRPLAVHAEGDWLVVAQEDSWWALDLSNGAVEVSGTGAAWAWPARVPQPDTCTLSAEALAPGLVGVPGALPQVRREGRGVIERLALPDGVELERHIGGCHHLTVTYTWRGGASEADPLAGVVRRLDALPLIEPADGVRAQLVEAARGARPEAGQPRVDLACGEASCAFSWGDEEGRAVLRAEYMFTL